MVSRAYLSLFIVLPLLAVAGCSSFREPPGVSYSKSATDLGINPVYPPREDMQVGDIYAVENHTAKDRLTARSAYIDTIDMTSQIQAYLGTRYKFATTTTGTGPIVLDQQAIQAAGQTDAAGGKVLTKSDFQTLPITGFPEIEVDSGITVGVAGQPKGLAAVFGFEAAKTLKMSLRYGGVTSYSVPTIVGAHMLNQYCESPKTSINCEASSLAYVMNLKYNLGNKDKDQVKGGYIALVSKVYLARQITYTFNDAILAAAAAATQGAGAAPTISGEAVNKAMDTDNAAMLSALADLQNSLNNASAAAKGGEGSGSVTFAGVSRNGVSFNEVFARPIVIGYEAATLPGAPDQEN